ncbi:tRNA lysidine(34) synthetase TilS [Aliarcobacter skirrowii]|uniref:tRNA(Ile)-lysidine synthase n=1 Tax=Aliarcobacter skirrowii CCUG 10374 TaxID=1032239 RepID=A0AAD0SJY7_9BACT|nr:tRNA lysidine(34) synthetase TilS [Aliarcobacter skirrowii]AXX84054.1 tRNA(Ile)-lysidine synthetase [Aliarcobacter skirrowii CCUG 10374]KAB0621758.1 tRNA lysidine(34) synthetase TilS [Aliarcobacter skirrowii CCUG 10374]RXI27011.1 tRNA lysidine(34) synthetase TilS [Aliarcobacter skirrowii CCUG 10374]SUU95452.1 tRNA(Ile)-lysidine synthase [Aliarcobacter skirrowii]
MNLDFSEIKSSKNLLAFSAGIDSTALFFLLLNSNISFDIAIVDYNIREQSKEEVAHAKNLAKKFNKKIYKKDIFLENLSNFEKQARDIRYNFFEEIIKKNSYDFLITAHQLNDKFEWFLMQLSKGAGLIELLGMSEIEDKEFYKIYRPLLNFSKDELISYLENKNIKYFVDESNIDEKYKRNYFRNSFSNSFLKEFKEGVKSSFNFLHNDLNSLNIDFYPIKKIEELEIFKNQNDNNLNLRVIDKSLKKRGILLSSLQREEIIKQKELTIAHKINIAITENYIFIAPKIKINMPKDFKEKCRVKKLPKNIREYIFIKNIDFKDLVF